MRTAKLLWISSVAAASAVAACNWAEFDDLEGQAWVDSTTKPDVKSADYGVAIQRGADAGESGSSGTLAVIGAGPGTYTELQYNASGASSLKTSTLQLPDQGIMSVDAQPTFLANPNTAEVALVNKGDTSSIVVATGTHTLQVRQLFVGANTSLGSAVAVSDTPDAATYMQPGPFSPGDTPGPAPLVAAGDVVLGTIYVPPVNFKQPACKLTDGANPIQVRALGAVKGAGTVDDVLVWNGADGKLLRYPGDVFNGCATKAPDKVTDPASKPAFTPGHGSQILKIDDTNVLLQGHQEPSQGNASFLQVYNATTLTPVGGPITTAGARSAAVLKTDTGTYAVVGYPGALVDGTAAGEVLIYKLSPGLDSAMPVARLHDAQAENNQQFGRSVAIMPFTTGKSVIAVAAANEIFVYFRANQSDGNALYGETRQGK